MATYPYCDQWETFSPADYIYSWTVDKAPSEVRFVSRT